MQNKFRPLIHVTPETQRMGVAITGSLTLLGWIGYQLVNFWSTAEGINLYFGYGAYAKISDYFRMSGPNWWVTAIALLVVGVDVLAVVIYLANAVFVTPDGHPMVSDDMATSVFGGWIIATAVDALLTWYVFAYRAEISIAAGVMQGPQMASAQAVGQAIPWGLTGLTWFGSFFLLQSTKAAARAVLTGAPKARAEPQPQRPPNNGGGGGGKFQSQPPQKPQGPHEPTYRPVSMKGTGGPPAQIVSKPQRGGTDVPEDLRSILDDYKGSLQ